VVKHEGKPSFLKYPRLPMKPFNVIFAWRDDLGIEQTTFYGPIMAQNKSEAMRLAEVMAEERGCQIRSVDED